MKWYSALLFSVVFAFGLDGCIDVETVPKETDLQVFDLQNDNTLENIHEIEGFEFVTTYDIGDYDLSHWRVTDSKVINITAQVRNIPEGSIVLIEDVYIKISLKSIDPQLNDLLQDSMYDSYHGTSQDGFFISPNYPYQKKFTIDGLSNELMDGWRFIWDSYGSDSMMKELLTERNLVKYGNIYANKIQAVYNVLIKYADEDFYHVVSVLDEFLIPVEYKAKITE